MLIVLTGGFYSQAEAKSPNVKDCLENGEDCSEPTANETTDKENSTLSDQSSLVIDLIKMALALVLVLALIYFLLKFLNKRQALHRQHSLENMGGITVGQSKSLQIVRLGSKFYLIGVGDNVDLLDEITDEDVIDELIKHSEEKEDMTFNTFFKTMTRKKQTKEQHDESSGHQFKTLFSNELKSLQENRQKLMNQHKARKDNDE